MPDQSATAVSAEQPPTVEQLHRIADEDIGANAPQLADWLHAFARRLEAEMRGEPGPLPDGEYARVEVMGHDSHTGWVTDGTRAGVPVMVIRDWDNRVIAEVPGQSLYRFVPLPTPLKRPEPRLSITASAPVYDVWNTIGDDDGDPF